MNDSGGRAANWAARFARAQATRPLWFALAALVISVGSVPFVLQLGLDTEWSVLLPKDRPSVQDLERVAGRVGGLSTLSMVVESDDTEALTRFAEALVPRLEALEAPEIRSIDWNVGTYETFVREHRYLYASLEDLIEVRNSLDDRLQYEKAKANPFYVALDDPPEDPEKVIARLEDRAKAKRKGRFREGFYLQEDGKLLVIFLRTDIRGGNVGAANALVGKLNAAVESLKPSTYAPDLRVEYAGDLRAAGEEYDAVMGEVVIATVLTIVLVLLVIYVFFRRVRAVPMLGLAILTPTLATFAIAEFTVDTLNTCTAFLGTVVIGNGINPGFNWLARYFEERRAGQDVESAIARTHLGVWRGTLGAALAAALAYGSLYVSDFHGFKDFAIITSVGMLLCWAGMLTFLPAYAALSERIRPLSFAGTQSGTSYGSTIWRIVEWAPRGIVWTTVVAVVASIALVVVAVQNDPLEYDFRNLRSTAKVATGTSKLNAKVSKIVGKAASTSSAIAVLFDERAEAPPFEDALESMRDRTKPPPFGKVRSIDDLVPDKQGKKIEVVGEIRELLLDVRKYADAELQARIDRDLPPASIRPVTIADLPEAVARSFTERDGTRGRILVVEAVKGKSVWDGRYLIEWANAIRSVEVKGAAKPALAGRATVFADILDVVVDDGPKAVAVSFCITMVLVLVVFRRFRDSMVVMASLLVGLVTMAGAMAALGMKINFLNFVAFPISFGNGVDYAVNTMGRYVQERDGERTPVRDAIRRAVSETGGAVILCSLTTIIGYISLFASANKALNSFGLAMGISEVTCLGAAVLAMPAVMLLRIGRKDSAA